LTIHEEYGSWMMELVPLKPFTTLCKYSEPFDELITRSLYLKKLLNDENNLFLLYCPVFGMLGVGDFHEPFEEHMNEIKNIEEVKNENENENENI
jgi:hypothetical protein